MIARGGRPPQALAALMLTAALAAVAWSLVLPAFQGPDEVLHVAAVQRLVDHGRLLPRAGEGEQLSLEIQVAAAEAGLGALVGNLDARPAFTALDERRWRARDARLGERRSQPRPVAFGPPIQGATRNPSLYTLYMAAPYALGRSSSVFARVTLMRLWNVPLIVAAVACTWLLAGELLAGARWPWVVAAGGVAVLPELGFITGTINPDVLLVALASGFLLAAVRTVRRGLSPARAGAVMALAAGAALTHPRGLVLVLVAPLALALATGGARASGRRTIVALGGAVVVAGGVLGVGVLAAQRLGTTLLGGSSAEGVGAPFSVRQFGSYLWQFYLPKLGFMDEPIGPPYGFREVFVETFWGTFASLEVTFAPWTYDLLQALMALLGAGVVAALVRHRRALRARWREAVLLGGTVGAYLLALHVFAYRTLLVDPTDPIIVGRYLLPFAGLGAVAVALALRGLPRRIGATLAGALLGGMVALELAGLGLTLTRFTL